MDFREVSIGTPLLFLLNSLMVFGIGHPAGLVGQAKDPGDPPSIEMGIGLSVGELKCEYARDPLGIDVTQPRFLPGICTGITATSGSFRNTMMV